MSIENIHLRLEDRDEMAYHIAPLLKNAVDSSGAYTTFLDAHKALADPHNKIEVTPTVLGDISKAAGVIIIITQ